MTEDSFSDKLKKVKLQSKRMSKRRSKIMLYITIILILMVATFFIVYNIHQMKLAELSEKSKKLQKAKTTAIKNLEKMFSKYPNDPHLNVYINKIENCDSVDEINKVLDDATKYIEFRIYKENVINNIKDIYGKYYSESLLAQDIVSKIQKASSIREIENILKNTNIEEDAKKYYLRSIENSIHPDKYYSISVFKKKRLMNGKELMEYIKKLNLADIKNLTIIPVSFNKVTIVVPATQCGRIPTEGSKIEIYNRENLDMEPIPAVVDSAYVIVSNIKYKESYNVFNIMEEGGNSTLSKYSDEYILQNVPGVLYATAADKLDYNEIISKFRRYGEKFDNITSETQIFDENAKYLLIVSIPSDDVSKLLSIKDMYIVKVD